MTNTVYNFSLQDLHNKPLELSSYQGKMLLIVNTASRCGFTPQYEGLEQLYQQYKDQLVVIACPCNQFGGQEPGDAKEIENFCSGNYGISFPVTQKIDVNGDNAHPLFQFLKDQLPGVLGTEGIKWNFTKFLIDHQGKPIKRYAPTDTPQAIAKDIKQLLLDL